MELNAKQQEAVEAIHGPLLILAGAGSGKTSVIVHRILYMIQQGIPPEEILAITFTQKAAQELKMRLTQSLGENVSRLVTAGTFHAICAKILRESSMYPGVIEGFTIYEERKVRSLLRQLLKHELRIDHHLLSPDGAMYYLSLLKNEGIDVASFRAQCKKQPWVDWNRAEALFQEKIPASKRALLGEVYARYQTRMTQQRALDFDDLLLEVVTLFHQHADALQVWQQRFSYIVVDEYQDTNYAQYLIVKRLSEISRNIAVVGDDSQSIYGFRGSDVRNILLFERDYPEARHIVLEENYRCTRIILQAANEVIRHNRHQKEKKLYTQKTTGEKLQYYHALSERDEARYIANEIKRGIQEEGRSYDDFAVLFRTNGQASAFEDCFIRMGIPYRLAQDTHLLDQPIVESVLAYLSFIADPTHAPALRHILNVPKRGVEKDAIESILRQQERDLLSFLHKPIGVLLPRHVRKNVKDFAILIERLHEAHQEGACVARLLPELLLSSGILSVVKEDPVRTRQLMELVAIAMTCEGKRIDEFLSFLENWKEQEEELSDSAVQLMTLHAAKGLEFPVVFLVGMEENVFPHKQSMGKEGIEEERRLCYVGITRAKEKLCFTHAKERSGWGKKEQNEPSRFLYEFTEDLFDAKLPRLPTRKSNG